jgi:hypothetical protein
MPEDPLFQRLRRELEAPPLVTPVPSRARYARTSPAESGWRWVKLGGAFAAGAIATALVITAGTGSPNPQVWTIRVVSALSQMGAPRSEASPSAPPPTSPSPSPTLTPAPSGPSSEAPEEASPGETKEGSGEQSSSGPSIEPSSTPEQGGGTDGGGTDVGGTEGGSSSLPGPSPSPEGDH